MSFKIPTPPLFSFQECLWFLDRNYDDCLHKVTPNAVLKALKIGQQLVLLEVSEEDSHLVVRVLQGTPDHTQPIIDFVTEWFDLNRNLEPFYALLKQDPDFAFMPEKYQGLRLMGIPDLFEALGWSIIGQQINLTFAYTLKRRLVENWGQSISYQGEKFYVFPTPSDLTQPSVSDFKPLQFSTRKAEYLLGIAQLFATQQISKSQLQALNGEGEILAELMKIRGVGKWTAHYTMMKSLRTMNNITYGDTGLYTALHQLKNLGKRASEDEINAVFAAFDGWKSYLTMYLWRSLSE